MLIPMILLLAMAGLSFAARATNIWVPPNATTRVLLPDVYGYSLEPIWVSDYLESNLTANLMSVIADVIGKSAPWRVGGTSADETYFHADLNASSITSPNATVTNTFNVSSSWYQSWADYFPENTDFIYTLDFADNSSAWHNAVEQAAAVWSALGSKLKLFELGNEVDHYIGEHWRAAGWDVAEYIPQWWNLTDQIIASDWYRNASSPPIFQAAVFADPPEVPDQQAELDDFDIVNLTRGGLVDPRLISTYSVHLYPQSTCDTERWYRLSLDLLSNHTVLWQNVSQYIPQVAAADAAGSPLVLGETNSVSCGGRSGISDTFGAALWSVDYVLTAASLGIQKLYFHIGAQSEYSSFVPVPYEYQNESLSAGIRSLFYGHYFLARVVASNRSLSVAAMPAANASDFSGYAVYAGDGLQKLVFIDTGVWNSSEGLHNPSTLGMTDSTSVSVGDRPVRRMRVQTPWSWRAQVNVVRLNGPGTNAKSEIDVSGVTFNPTTGTKLGCENVEILHVGRRGMLSFDIEQAQAVLLEL